MTSMDLADDWRFDDTDAPGLLDAISELLELSPDNDGLEPLPDPRVWQTDGACRTGEYALMLPNVRVRTWVNETHDYRRAKRVCSTCPVQGTCLEYGIDWGRNTSGVYGGAGNRTLQRLHRLRAQAGHRHRTDCDCDYCHEARRVLTGSGERRYSPPEGVTHGIRSTAAKGCPCVPCLYSVSRYSAERGATA